MTRRMKEIENGQNTSEIDVVERIKVLADGVSCHLCRGVGQAEVRVTMYKRKVCATHVSYTSSYART